MQQNPSNADKVNGLLQEQQSLLAAIARTSAQLKAQEDRLKIVDAALEGASIGKGLAEDAAAKAPAPTPAPAPEADATAPEAAA